MSRTNADKAVGNAHVTEKAAPQKARSPAKYGGLPAVSLLYLWSKICRLFSLVTGIAM
jgi:hypothetical protein